MSDRAALLRSIVESPADDDLRFVFADWLEEHGRCERAELIRMRGFVDYAELPLRRFLQHAGRLLRAAPLLRELYLDHCGRSIVALADCPHLARVELRL